MTRPTTKDDSPPEPPPPPLHLDFDEVPGVSAPMTVAGGDALPATTAASTRRTPGALFEVGVVYRDRACWYLAVSERLLITFRNGVLHEVRPRARYDVVRAASVEELCVKWAIPLQRFDAMVLLYLAPSRTREPGGGGRRRRAVEDEVWRSRRTVRLLAG